jgi:hypothetical protein
LSGPSRSALGPLIALAILLALLVAVGALTVAPLWRLIQGYNQDLAELEQRLLIQRRVAAGAAGLQSRLQELEERIRANFRTGVSPKLRVTSSCPAGTASCIVESVVSTVMGIERPRMFAFQPG